MVTHHRQVATHLNQEHTHLRQAAIPLQQAAIPLRQGATRKQQVATQEQQAAITLNSQVDTQLLLVVILQQEVILPQVEAFLHRQEDIHSLGQVAILPCNQEVK